MLSRCRYRLAEISGLPESTLQHYADQELPPRSDILLIKLAHTTNVSIEWLASGQEGKRGRGELPGGSFSDVTMVELRDIRAALHMEQIRAFLPFSRVASNSIQYQGSKEAHAARGGRGSAAANEEDDMPFGEQICRQQVVAGEGLYVFSVPTGLAEEAGRGWSHARICGCWAGDLGKFEPNGVGRLLVGKVIFRE